MSPINQIISDYHTAQDFREKASNTSGFNPGKKLELAEQAIDATDKVIGGLIRLVNAQQVQLTNIAEVTVKLQRVLPEVANE
ncbi:hypothetical protein [Thalassotalea euphylliae]|uniref:Uncharacterized protein n=1 Tax=Thalassotalea euphylliae TaxID=1655234 RepID=A0A3E0U261_9GAMM|nr:hypothetical protein [Thalassotalea euphylliae]REL31071.1 hypothetical protein DXX94_10290 [Thalassotalea euphylliae]